MKTSFPVPCFVLKTLRHKFHVFRFGLLTGAPIWRLLIHDWRKLTPPEIFAYARMFCGDGGDELGFAYAWLHHATHSPHHWDHWIPVTAHRLSPTKGGEPLPMPEWAVREMVADWLGASTSYEGFTPDTLETWVWYQKEKDTIRLHPESRAMLEKVLAEFFAKWRLRRPEKERT